MKVSISPSSSILKVGQSLQFSATVSGASNAGLKWLVNGVIGGSSSTGTISATGLYTAPAVVPPKTVIVTAQSVVLTSAAASASVSVVSATVIAVSVSPASVTLQVGQSQQFTGVVSGTTNTALTWLINGVVGGSSSTGTISASGLYTAPAVLASKTVTVTAQSVAQASAVANASVTVLPAPVVSVTLSPTSVTLQVGQSQQFQGVVSGTIYTGLNWMVNGVRGGNSTVGTISTSGFYTAPRSLPSVPVTITAQSIAQSSAVAHASVSITPAPVVSISISPANASVQVRRSQQFSATISGTSNTAVNWMVNSTLGGNSVVGTVTSFGMYTAPASVPSDQVVVSAQSVAQTTASASATVSVTPMIVSVSISPTSASLQVGQSEQFSAIVSGVSNTSVNWLVSGIPGGNSLLGTINSAGLYTAPANVPSSPIVVTAQSSANRSSSASASVSILQPVSHQVNLSWSGSSSPVGGYNVYRGTQATGPFTKLNSSLETATVFTDGSVNAGQTYYYVTTAVSSSGVESRYSNVAQATIP